jgi:hypothetical protein
VFHPRRPAVFRRQLRHIRAADASLRRNPPERDALRCELVPGECVNPRAVAGSPGRRLWNPPLNHTKLESTVRYLGIEVDALEMAEQTKV